MKTVEYILSSALCVSGIIHLVQGQADWTVGQVVQTSSGPVTGHGASVNTAVSEYLGIPFAAPPVGDLRWTAPQKYNGTSAINGTNYGFSCPAQLQPAATPQQIQAANVTSAGVQILESVSQIGDNFSEDCLTLNIWTKPQVGDSKKAVLLWIYGGGFTSGNSDNPTYNGQYIVEQEDVIIVSFNYRLNIFGFPGTPDATQNLGLLDQRLAVEWVRDNIAAFGGDPSRITLFGQSAGSASVDYFSFAWVTNPIAHGFIQESGSVLGPAPGLGPLTADVASSSWFSVAAALNCGNSTDDQAAVLICMKTKTYSELLAAAVPGAGNSTSTVPTSFGPTVDGITVFSDYPTRAAAGNFAKLPLLLGSADYEAGLFKVLQAFSNVTEPDAYWTAFDDVVFTCPCAARANASVLAKVPTWRYRWFGAFPNTRVTTIPFSGAWHASELSVLFNTTLSGAGIPPITDAEIQIGSYFRGAWAAFAKNPTSGLSTYEEGWPLYSPTEKTLVQLAYQNLTGANLVQGNTYDGFCSQVVALTPSSNSTATAVGPRNSSPVPTYLTSGAGRFAFPSMMTWGLVVTTAIGLVVM